MITLVVLGVSLTLGLSSYVDAYISVNKQSNRDLAKLRLLEAGGPGGYSGTLAWVNGRGEGGLAVWGKYGLRYYPADEHTIYSTFKICSPENMTEILVNKKSIRTQRTVTKDVVEWAKQARKGDYVTIEVAREEMGGNIGRAREVKLHDWPAYLPSINR